jgi:hypothetical protein
MVRKAAHDIELTKPAAHDIELEIEVRITMPRGWRAGLAIVCHFRQNRVHRRSQM